MKQVLLEIADNKRIAPSVFKCTLAGDVSGITAPGQFINLKIDGCYLRRPISVFDKTEESVSIIYKTIGRGTEILSLMQAGDGVDVLTGLGNGYDISLSGDRPLLIGGGVGIPPLYYLAVKLIEKGVKPVAILGFNKKSEVFCEDDFKAAGCDVFVTTVDGSYGIEGFVTDAFPVEYSFFYTCGPEPMLKAVYSKTVTSGQFSFEERMGCGFGACMGCSCKTITGYKRICKDGPVLRKEEILWAD
ncbi:MAG: dihydroorotate dehydrogenase electron transfer subunit [Clostridiales bacterium]|nr:dihydroorotate dehydrogenase electron transfer subunit [Clostridiales bacterium]